MFVRVTAPLVEQLLSTGLMSKRLPQGSLHRQSLYIAASYLTRQAGESQGMVRGTEGMAWITMFLVSTYTVIRMGQFLSHSGLFHHKSVHFLECDNNSMYNGLSFYSHTNFTRTTGLERVLVNSWSILQMSCLEASWYLLTKASTWCTILSLITSIS